MTRAVRNRAQYGALVLAAARTRKPLMVSRGDVDRFAVRYGFEVEVAERTRSRALADLVELGVLEQEGTRYGLTRKGRQITNGEGAF